VLTFLHQFVDLGEFESGGDDVGGGRPRPLECLPGSGVPVAVGGEDEGFIREEFDCGVSAVADVAVRGVAVVVLHADAVFVLRFL
jgi:hypothetical protein